MGNNSWRDESNDIVRTVATRGRWPLIIGAIVLAAGFVALTILDYV